MDYRKNKEIKSKIYKEKEKSTREMFQLQLDY